MAVPLPAHERQPTSQMGEYDSVLAYTLVSCSSLIQIRKQQCCCSQVPKVLCCDTERSPTEQCSIRSKQMCAVQVTCNTDSMPLAVHHCMQKFRDVLSLDYSCCHTAWTPCYGLAATFQKSLLQLACILMDSSLPLGNHFLFSIRICLEP